MGSVGAMLQAYRSDVLSTSSPAEADEVLATTLRLMKSRPEAWPILFDRVYSVSDLGFNTKPNALVVSAIEGVAPGAAIDVAMGQGRNAVFLAGRGWAVTGIDVSSVGVESARLQARANGHEIDAICMDHESYDLGENRWDLMVFTYAPAGLTRPEMVSRIARALKAGGRVVVESFADNAGSRPVRPVDINGTEIKQAYRDFDIVFFEEVVEIPDWNDEAEGIVRMIAVAPAG